MTSETAASTMNQEETTGLVPKLRFPEFRNAGVWEESTVEEVISTITPPKKLQTPDYQPEGEFPIVDQSQDKICGWTNDRNALIAERLPVIIFGDHTCTLKFMDHPFAQGADGIKIVRPKRGIDVRFLFFALQANPVVQETYKRHFSMLKEKKLAFPDPRTREQECIAACLSSLDELIAAQAQKVEALKTHKKGLMQQLFPREGEAQPRLRFPEFLNGGEWVEQPVGDFGRVVTGTTPSTSQPAFYGGDIPFVSPADISGLRFVNHTKSTLTQEGFAETRPIRAGSILFVCIGSTIGKVAQTVHDCATNQQINAVVPSREYSDGFIFYALSFASERIALLAGRQAVPIINKSLFSSVRLRAPKLPEQERIAMFLSSLDALISAETQQLEALKTHKKGLMQQLFPSTGVDEI